MSTKEQISQKYGERIFTGDYKAIVVAVLNENGSFDMGYDGGMIEAAGLIFALHNEMNVRFENTDKNIKNGD